MPWWGWAGLVLLSLAGAIVADRQPGGRLAVSDGSDVLLLAFGCLAWGLALCMWASRRRRP